ncbi:nitric oxide synthase oxygenase [Embleya sp. NPDC059237]|uniref:nitric oxide synthase oxygenase n=1 Tax=Embleya sp. NPDC059237 TaxID=3346784 RepID=UPI0036C1E59A
MHSPRPHGAVDPELARSFLERFLRETKSPVDPASRWREIAEQIRDTGTYTHTSAELTWGARVAWRNSARCIGRLYWNSLAVRDRRHVSRPDEVAAQCAGHLRETWRGGRIRPTLTVFAPDTPTGPQVRIWNEQLIRYAGYRRADGTPVGDGRNLGITDLAHELGWRGEGTEFDPLPLIIEGRDGRLRPYALPPDAIREIALTHPEHPGFADLGLRWHAVPAISNMRLEIGGVSYSAAPFNGWYMGTEIGARNLVDADRYDALPAIAELFALDTSSERTLWRDRALIELNRAVLHSFDTAGATITDHHTESTRFLRHVEREAEAGRRCPADWSWIVPPVSGGLTPVYHRYYDDHDEHTLTPAYVLDEAATRRAAGEVGGLG